MDIEKVHADIVKMEELIRQHGLQASVGGYINWVGDEFRLTLRAQEGYDEKKHWMKEKEFTGPASTTAGVMRSAFEWVHALPDAEQRALELMVQKLHKLADELPDGATEIIDRAWEEIRVMVVTKAEDLAKRGLPSPNTITHIEFP